MTQEQTIQATLHILNKSPSHPRFATCLAALHEGDTLALAENAVLAVTDSTAGLPRNCVALGADLEARGLAGNPNVQIISYGDLVRLTAEHSRTVSW
ncbi:MULTISPECIES: sulfurtransferase complex subunit TusB [Marinobacter]|jgi:tRNA 2-thiouridine synthesizing protein B|uniref:sulfurtransferase complex subunit TusB n=1 Tax=Marinobacter TaxID=2742 RepID=UPI000D0F33B7|nr:MULTISPECIES: sulfurtransferase complex subunit TusB [Marinobacter]MDX5441903.1 sulfurtransferase complex subunit TusB [Alteromonadaceae bacterium]WBU43150.1 sulfurtransferase complex subunit TusB [Marinobacter alkaliphilus]MDX5327827.1 sulfurtransferase complex subunit TusB [Marinobacter sp.]MDX5335148.1 sulfurtransferase complex subunit TusB [Marinobacter sp.]MDX5385912.1 sulfurtransferase complex subunit TusB [Marinobacter sp.]